MEFIGQRLIYICKYFLLCIVLSSCQSIKSVVQEDKLLECILSNFIIPEDDGNQQGSFLVEQQDHWGEFTSIIIVSYIPNDKIDLIHAEEKSRFNQLDVYFYRTEITDANNEKIIQKIPNQLKWVPFKSQELMNADQPPFDPLTVQLIFNHSSNCVEGILIGENHFQKGWETKCKSCPPVRTILLN